MRSAVQLRGVAASVIAMGALALGAGCGDTAMPDMAVEADLSVAADLTTPPTGDMSKPVDAGPLPDLAKPDLGPIADFMTPIDFTEIIDMTPIPPDFAPPSDFTVPPDFTKPPDLIGADLNPGIVPYKYVWNKASLPNQKGDYSIDLNGDGKLDNALGDLVVVLRQFSVDLQLNVDDGVAQGVDVKLVRFDTADPLFMLDQNPFVLLRAGVAKPNPDFSGNGMFASDNNKFPATYKGVIANQRFFAVSPTAVAMSTDIKLFFTFFGQMPVDLSLHGTHLQFEMGFDAKTGSPGLVNGQVQGSVLMADLLRVFVPGIAGAFNAQVMNNGPSKMLILQNFDLGGCVNPNNSQARVDAFIDECEISTNGLFQALLVPDVQIYNNGVYQPNPQNAMPDSFSVGIGFNAVRAIFQ